MSIHPYTRAHTHARTHSPTHAHIRTHAKLLPIQHDNNKIAWCFGTIRQNNNHKKSHNSLTKQDNIYKHVNIKHEQIHVSLHVEIIRHAWAPSSDKITLLFHILRQFLDNVPPHLDKTACYFDKKRQSLGKI
jgi:hypothetical protein